MGLILPDKLPVVWIASFPAGPWQTNCYLLAAEPGAECVIIDPGMTALPTIEQTVEEHGLTPVGVLLTHGHIDHLADAEPVCARWNIPLWIAAEDRHLLTEPTAGLGSARDLMAQLGIERDFREPAVVHELVDGEPIAIADLKVQVTAAPGHTPGCMLLSVDWPADQQPEGMTVSQAIFTGDVLFAGSIGRTDLPGGDWDVMDETLRTVITRLDPDAVILPGHGGQSTIARELATNPFLQNYERP